MDAQPGTPANHRSIYWISVLALFTAALANAFRGGITRALELQLFAGVDPQRSGELITGVMGKAFLGFALSLLVISPLLDRIGAKRVVLFASFCFIVGPALVLLAPSVGGSAATLIGAAMAIWGFGWGATEASINPVTATMYPNDKTGKLNSLHAYWPFGLIVGGLLTPLFTDVFKLSWQSLVMLAALPGLLVGIWAMRHDFPQTETTVKGISFKDMMLEPIRKPGFWIFFAIMFLTASAELAPGAWVDFALTNKVGFRGILLMAYVSAIMFIMRHFAGTLAHKFSDIGLLFMCTIPAGLGLYLLGIANSPVAALVAATLWAIGVCFMWPTMLAAVSRRYPNSGPWGIGLIGFAGALAINYALPKLGAIYDNAKIAKAGGEAAFKALADKSPQQTSVLNYAAEESFKSVALIPVALFVIFGLLWLFERNKKA